MTVKLERHTDRFANPFRQVGGIAAGGRPALDDDELVAAKASDDVVVADSDFEAIGDGLQSSSPTE